MDTVRGIGSFVLGVLTSWPLLVALFIAMYRLQIGELLGAITEKFRRSTSVKLPGIEFTQTTETVTTLAQDVLLLKQQATAERAAGLTPTSTSKDDAQRTESIESLIEQYDTKTHIPDYAERMRVKTDIQNRMEKAARASIPAVSHLIERSTEGSLLAVVAASKALPVPEAFDALLRVGRVTKQLFIRNAMLYQFVQLLSDGKSASREELMEARKLANEYGKDEAKPPDRTFQRNLVYYKQVLTKTIVRTKTR